MKKLQTPLYEQFYNSLNTTSSMSTVDAGNKENVSDNMNLPPKSRSPNRVLSRRLSAAVEINHTSSPVSRSKRVSNIGGLNHQDSEETRSSQLRELKELLFHTQQEPPSPRSVNSLLLL